jgi:hypothetical protein
VNCLITGEGFVSIKMPQRGGKYKVDQDETELTRVASAEDTAESGYQVTSLSGGKDVRWRTGINYGVESQRGVSRKEVSKCEGGACVWYLGTKKLKHSSTHVCKKS